MYQQIVTAVGRMWPCTGVTYDGGPVIYYEFDSNFTYSFPYIVPSCDTIEAIRDCFTAVNAPKSDREKKWRAELFKKYSDLFTTATNDLAKLYFYGFINICYRKDYPIVKCLESVNFDSNHNHKRCVHYELDESKEKRYQYFDVPYFKNSKGIEELEELAINKYVRSLRGNYSKFLQYVEKREKYTKQLKRENTLEQYIQMNNETNACISASECDFSYFHNDDVQVSCNCFELIRNCLRHINKTLPNYSANKFFNLNGKFGCYKEDYPIVRCLEFGHGYILGNSYISYKEKTKRCVRYELDESKPKIYQNFDVPFFYDSKNPKEFNFNKAVTMRYDIRSMLVSFIDLVAKINLTFTFL